MAQNSKFQQAIQISHIVCQTLNSCEEITTILMLRLRKMIFCCYNQKKLKKGTIIFIIFALIWQIAVGVIYGLFFGYNQTDIASMENITTAFPYQYTSGSSTNFKTNSTQFPFPLAAVAIAIILLVVGLSMIAGYIERSTVTGMTFTLLIFALTLQNFFIYRDFWNRIGINDSSANVSLSTFNYPYINYINFRNDLQANNQLPSASFLDAVGASLAMYVGYTAVIGRIGLGEVFFLSWIGTFIYELNSQILWRLFIPDNGYPSRAFAYGGMLGLVSAIILGKRNLTKNSPAFRSSYKIMALALLGIIFVWCSFPILVLSSVYTSASGKIVTMAGQVNIWLALASSVLGCFGASSLSLRKFNIHDLVFSSITGAIAFSSSTDVNYNPGGATAIGFSVGFIISYAQSKLKRRINKQGVLDSNSVIFHFLIPSIFAAILSAFLEGLGQSAASFTAISVLNATTLPTFNTTSISYPAYIGSGRDSTGQGVFQLAGWGISVGLGAVAGVIIGIIYRLTNDSFEEIDNFFNDATLFQQHKIEGEDEDVRATAIKDARTLQVQGQ